MQIRDRKKPGQKSPQKSDLGTSWAPFGKVWGRLWEGLGSSWGLLGCFGNSVFHAGIWNGLQNALGAVWLEFWFDFNGFGADFGKVLGRVWDGLKRICEHSG